MKLIIDIPEEVKAEIDAKHTNAHIEMIAEKAIQNGTPIPDNATNEETIRALFPYTIFVEDRTNNRIVISKDWWNSPYQKGGKE